MAKIRYAVVHGWTGTGITMQDAKADATRQIREAAQGYWTPVLCRYRGLVGVVYREPGGWSYTIVDSKQPDKPLPYTDYFQCSSKDRADCVRAMCRHLAQYGFIPGEEAIAPSFVTEPIDRREHEGWMRWQNAYRAHKLAHPDATDDECREAASRIY